jgi:inorganic pyrophosphatase
MKNQLLAGLSLLLVLGCSVPPHWVDARTLVGPENYLNGYPARNADGTINVVVEIPAGTNDKWEVDKRDGALRWELKHGAPRVVAYLAYPGNYGMIPRTILPKEMGGDGDPLDVILLGPAVPRGEVVRARVVGVLELLDDGERDDKLIAVRDDTAFSDCRDIADLRENFHGVLTILETWFANYKGPGEMESRGFADRARALVILESAASAYALEI